MSEQEFEKLTTGNPRVDDVIESLDVLTDRPVGEHPQVFEAAQESLRAALTSEPDA